MNMLLCLIGLVILGGDL